MIALDFAYARPQTLAEAADEYGAARERGRQPMWFGGGTEILTRARLGQIETGLVIDLKDIPECRAHGRDGDELVFGAAVTLDDLDVEHLWPLLADASGRVADHTTRCQITLGGNIAGHIRYREAALPFMLVDAQVVIAGAGGAEVGAGGETSGARRVAFSDIFDGTLTLPEGAFLVQLRVPARVAASPHFCAKKTRLDWVDYPLVTVVGTRQGGEVRAAFSGLSDAPFRSPEMEAALNQAGRPVADRAREAVRRIPEQVLDDIHGSADYRRFVLQNTLEDMLQQWEGMP